MTLQQAKDEVAKKYGYPSWFDINFHQLDETSKITSPPYSEEYLRDEAAELYARSKWDEACDLQRKSCGGKVLWGQDLLDIERNVYKATKPEFK